MIIKCQDCKKHVNVKFSMFGGGYVAICPDCKGVAANFSTREKEDLEQKKQKEKK